MEPAAESSQPARESRRVCVLIELGHDLAVGDHRLAEAKAELAEGADFGLGQVRVPLDHEFNGIAHPFDLLIGSGLDDATAMDMTEQLVASLIEGCFFTFLNFFSGSQSASCVLTDHIVQTARGIAPSKRARTTSARSP